MSKKLILLVAVMSLALSSAAFAAVENIRVSGDMSMQAITRDLSLGSTWNGPTSTVDSESYLFSQIRLRFDADLTENVSTVLQLINERVWGQGSFNTQPAPFNSVGDGDIELDLAYVKLEEFMNEDVTLTIGRQDIYFGNGLIIGDSTTNRMAPASTPVAMSDLSMRKSFDAVRTDWDLAPWTLTGIFAKPYEGVTNIWDDVSLWGINANYAWNDYNGETELYLFYANNSPLVQQYANGPIGGPAFQPREDQSKVFTVGGRMQYDPNDNWTLGVEGAFQFGDASLQWFGAPNDEPIRAFAAQAEAEYRFLNDYDATLKLNFTYLSGEDDLLDGSWTGWNPMFEDQTPGEILNILFMNSNMMYTKLTGTMMPREDVTLGLSWTWAKLAEKDALFYPTMGPTGYIYVPMFGPAGAGNGSPTGIGNWYAVNRDNSDLGHEIDAWAEWDYTEDVSLNLVGAWFIPGDFFDGPVGAPMQNDSTAYSIRGGVSVEY